MKAISRTLLALSLGVVASCAVYGQPPGYGGQQPPPPSGPYDQRYGAPGYDGRDYDDDVYYGAPAPRVEVGFFYDDLAPYGDWVRTREHGWAWFPSSVDPSWRPYYDGRWVMTEYGWTWVSYEPFGWATYHYGRWAWDNRFGWLWVPGTVWGPAWVSWQHGGGYVGWAPLPPQVGFEFGIGIRLGGFDLRLGIRPDAYNFVHERAFLEPRLAGYYQPTARNVTIIHNTTNITNYTYVDNRVINQGVDRYRIEQVTGRKLQQRRVTEVRSRESGAVAADEVRIYRPEKQKLETVRAARRGEGGERVETYTAPRVEQRPTQKASPQRREPPEVVVAPRPANAPHPDLRKLEAQERREKEQLESHRATEQRRIEKLHKEESAKAKAQADREQLEKRHQAERQALEAEARQAAQQLEARQKAKREAARVVPPADRKSDEKTAAGSTDEKTKGKRGDKGKPKKSPPPPA